MVDFVKPMSNRDIPTCIALIKQVSISSATDPAIWIQTIDSLLEAIELHYDQNTLLAILKELPQAALETLFEKISQSPAALKNSTHALLEFIVNEAPPIHQNVFKLILNELTDTDLLHFLAKLLPQSQQKNLACVLMNFCERLYNEVSKELEQWDKSPYSPLLVHALLTNPECIYQLSIPYSRFYTWTSWSNTAEGLKHRIDALLNYRELETNLIYQIAITWLTYFGNHPDQFYTVLTSLNQSKTNRTTIGNQNLSAIKKVCWTLLKPGTPYNEEELTQLFYAPKGKVFDPVAYHMAQFELQISQGNLPSLDLGKIFAKLPNDQAFLDLVYTNELFNTPDACAQLFSQMAAEQKCSDHLIALHPKLSQQESSWVKQFLSLCLEKLKTDQLNNSAIHVLNVLILSNTPHMDINNEQDQQIILKVLILLSTLNINHPSMESTQIMENFLAGFICQHSDWKNLLLANQAFTDTALCWLKSTDISLYKNHMEIHPLSALVINNTPRQFDRKLRGNPLFHQFITALLLNPPEALDNAKFKLWFELLPISQRKNLEKTFKEKLSITPVHDEAYQPDILLLPDPVEFIQDKLHEEALSIDRSVLENDTKKNAPQADVIPIKNEELDTREDLISCFIQSPPEKLNEDVGFNKLLEYTYQQQQLPDILKTLNTRGLSSEQKISFSEKCLSIAPSDQAIITEVINLNSWSWLEMYMKTKTEGRFELFKAALSNTDYIKKINQSHTEFSSLIEHNYLSPANLLELIKTTQDKKIKTILSLSLLSHVEFFNQLTGESILKRLENKEKHQPSRINALVNQIDFSLLSTDYVHQLQPEAAISIFFAITSFPHLSMEITQQLLAKHPQIEVIDYWLHHYALMPNAYKVLAHLLTFDEPQVQTVLITMAESIRNQVIKSLLPHLDLFKQLPPTLVKLSCEEHLIQAIQLYLQASSLRGQPNPTLINYIHQATESLFDKGHPFSSQAIQLLLTLNHHAEFTKLNQKTASLINCFLRSEASKGEIDLFYKDQHVNIQNMVQHLQLKPVNTSAASTKPVQVSIPEHPLITEINKQNKPVTAFEYFLIHFKGNMAQLGKLLEDFLVANRHTTSSIYHEFRKSINHFAILLNRATLDVAIKQVIFDFFLKTPNLIDEVNSLYLLRFNGTKLIKHFGLQGGEKNYQQVIKICTWGINKLDAKQHANLIAIATQAKAEAEQELSFAQDTGLFGYLFSRIQRCWIYGWTGFFQPNLPEYVAPASNSAAEPEPAKKESKPVSQPTKAIQASPFSKLESLLEKGQSPELTRFLQQHPKEFQAIIDELNVDLPLLGAQTSTPESQKSASVMETANHLLSNVGLNPARFYNTASSTLNSITEQITGLVSMDNQSFKTCS